MFTSRTLPVSTLRPGDELGIQYSLRATGIDPKSGKSFEEILWEYHETWLSEVEDKAWRQVVEQYGETVSLRIERVERGSIDFAIVLAAMGILANIEGVIALTDRLRKQSQEAAASTLATVTGQDNVTNVNVTHNHYYYRPAGALGGHAAVRLGAWSH